MPQPFITYVDAMDERTQCALAKFADDMKIDELASCKEDTKSMQHYIDRLSRGAGT